MSDPDQTRPSLPDPQRDRHVAFAGDAPDSDPAGTDVGEAAAARASSGETWATAQPAATTLPAEAWAPRPSTPESSPSAPSWSRGPDPTPSILSSPPVRPAPRRRPPNWLAFLLVPPLLLGVANAHDDGSGADGCTVTTETGTYDCGSFDAADGTDGGVSGIGAEQGVIGVWAEDVTESTTPLAPLLKGSPNVSPVPAGTTVLRVEVVSTDSSAAPVQTQIDTTADDMPIDAWDQGTPHALDIHLDEQPKRSLRISVNVTSGTGTVQCRVYAGSTLVAIATSTTSATCSPAL